MPGSLVRLLGRRTSRAALPIVGEIPDEALMVRVGKGDRAAFETLFVRYREAVWGFFRRRVADVGAAEELTQDTFLAVLTGASRYEGRAVFRAWLFGIAFNLLMAWRRRRQQNETFEVEPAAPASDQDRALWVRSALARLEPEEREILMLREYEQLSYQEIAQVLVLPLNTVRSRLFRARAAMRLALDGSGGEARHDQR